MKRAAHLEVIISKSRRTLRSRFLNCLIKNDEHFCYTIYSSSESCFETIIKLQNLIFTANKTKAPITLWHITCLLVQQCKEDICHYRATQPSLMCRYANPPEDDGNGNDLDIWSSLNKSDKLNMRICFSSVAIKVIAI